jgi:hypothetical protein
MTSQSLLSNNCNFNSLSTISKFYYCVDQFNKTIGLSIIHINCQSIVKKLEEIRIFVVFTNLTFCALVKVGFKNNNTMTTNFVLMVMIFKGVIEAEEEVADL